MRLNLSLKWKLVLFYFFLGMIPLLIISFYSSYIASKSISKITEKQIDELMIGVSNQISASYERIKGDIFQLADNPMIQLSFLQFKFGQRMNTVRDKLALYRSNSEFYDRITLFTGEGDAVLSVPAGSGNVYAHIDKLRLREIFNYDFYVKEYLGKENYLVMIKRVYDFEDNTLPVGMLVFEVPVKKVLNYFIKLDLGYSVLKIIENADGIKILDMGSDKTYGSKLIVYTKKVPYLNWTIKLGIPKNVLFSDIYELRDKSLLFSLFISLFAFIVAMYFVEKFLQPIRNIIAGTEKFSQGNFDYEIKLYSGKELKTIAEAINKMARRLEKRQAELIQANKLASLGLLAAGIAHEVKNPLAGIRATMQLIQRKSGDSEIEKMASDVIGEIDRLNKIVMDLLQFSKPDEIRKSDCDILLIIDKAINLVRKKIDEKSIKVIKDVERCIVRADCDHILHIIINIILNSISAVEEDTGIIEIKGTVEGEKYILSISDNGMGIPEDKIENIFDPFFSLKEDGIGLGLSIVYTLMQKNNISYRIWSKKGEGTTLKLIFKDIVNEKYSHSR